MVRLSKIYTRTGDDGQTSLGNGARVGKHSLRIEAIGAVDEANAALGLARVAVVGQGQDDTTIQGLARIQNDLFDLGADLCVPLPDVDGQKPLRITPAQVAWLEQDIDRMNAELAPLNSFILPGGNELSARLHVARVGIRRAERAIAALALEEAVNPALRHYINRLSDHAFVLCRYVNGKGKEDILWVPGGVRPEGQ